MSLRMPDDGRDYSGDELGLEPERDFTELVFRVYLTEDIEPGSPAAEDALDRLRALLRADPDVVEVEAHED